MICKSLKLYQVGSGTQGILEYDRVKVGDTD